MNSHSATIISFDCFGTLIDWESGITSAIRPILEAHNLDPGDDAVLEHYAALESQIENEKYRNYKAVLAEVMRRFADRLGFKPTNSEIRALEESLPSWKPFPDTVDALRSLKKRYKLAIISNIDNDLVLKTAGKLGVEFDWIVTAEHTRAYKPSLDVFRFALNEFSIEKRQVLHVAQSLFHDIAPAAQLGISSVWINRRWDKPGFGATPAKQAKPEFEMKSLSELVRFLEADKT